MPQKAHVTSLEAIEAFRASLIIYVSQARPALEEVSADVLRTRVWLENDQRTFWQNQMRRRTKELEEAQAALFSARVSNLGHETAAQQMAVHRTKRAVEESETKLRVVKKWSRDFDGRVQPLVKQIEKLHTVLSNDLVKAVADLAQTINTLAAYAEIKAPPSVAEVPLPGRPPSAANSPEPEPPAPAAGKTGGAE